MGKVRCTETRALVMVSTNIHIAILQAGLCAVLGGVWEAGRRLNQYNHYLAWGPVWERKYGKGP